MIAKLGRWGVQALVGLFALLGFLFVPLGERTGFEHLRAIVTTDAAAQAARDVWQGAIRARQKLFESIADDGPAQLRAAPLATTPLASPSDAPDAGADASLAYP